MKFNKKMSRQCETLVMLIDNIAKEQRYCHCCQVLLITHTRSGEISHSSKHPSVALWQVKPCPGWCPCLLIHWSQYLSISILNIWMGQVLWVTHWKRGTPSHRTILITYLDVYDPIAVKSLVWDKAALVHCVIWCTM